MAEQRDRLPALQRVYAPADSDFKLRTGFPRLWGTNAIGKTLHDSHTVGSRLNRRKSAERAEGTRQPGPNLAPSAIALAPR